MGNIAPYIRLAKHSQFHRSLPDTISGTGRMYYWMLDQAENAYKKGWVSVFDLAACLTRTGSRISDPHLF